MMKLDFLQLKKLGVFDITLLVLFVVYVALPISTPQFLVPVIDSPLGMVALFAAAVGLFLYRSPVLGVLFVLVAYELLRRNHYVPPASPIQTETQYMANRIPQALPTQSQKNSELNAMNPAKLDSLEEEVISKEAPVGKSHLPVFTSSEFLPMADKSKLGMTKI